MTIHTLRRQIVALLPVVALTVIVGCSAAPAPTLRVGLNPWPGYEFLFLAQEKGFYRDEGVSVRLIEFNSLTDARRAYERGQLDAMGTTVIEVLQARDQSSRSPQIVQVVDYSDGADVILAQPEIKNGASLYGKRVGVELASLGVYVLARALAIHGLKLADVKTISMDQSSMEEAFQKSELDAVVTYPPASIKLLRDDRSNTIFSTAEISGEVIDVIAVEENINTVRRDDVAKLLRAFQRAVAYTAQNPADAHAIMAAREGISADEFRSALNDGIKVLSAADQAAFFKPGGKLAGVVDASDRILRETGQLKGADRRSNIANAAFVEIESK